VEERSQLRKSSERACQKLEDIRREMSGVEEGLTADDWLNSRARIGVLMAGFDEEMEAIDGRLRTTGARSRIIRYLQLRIGQTVTKDEISGVAGIHEWARRVRELRQDEGWAIHSSNTLPGLRIGEYSLLAMNPDPDLARTWTLARQMRKLKTAGGVPPPKRRVLEFLRAIYPLPADREQLAHVAGSGQDAARVLDELAAEGWSIVAGISGEGSSHGDLRLGSLIRVERP
jgi:hypothetical protein